MNTGFLQSLETPSIEQKFFSDDFNSIIGEGKVFEMDRLCLLAFLVVGIGTLLGVLIGAKVYKKSAFWSVIVSMGIVFIVLVACWNMHVAVEFIQSSFAGILGALIVTLGSQLWRSIKKLVCSVKEWWTLRRIKEFCADDFDDGDRIEPGTLRKHRVKGREYVFCWIPKGKFKMGSETEETDWTQAGRDSYEMNPVEKEITFGFWMLETPVTQKLWESVMGYNPSTFSNSNSDSFYSNLVKMENTDKFPVESVNWFECVDFVNRLNCGEFKGGILKSWCFELPTEIQWEYACRAGKAQRPFSFGDHLKGELANCNGNRPYWKRRRYDRIPKGENRNRTTNVKHFQRNAWGLYDMHGNVWEWCGEDEEVKTKKREEITKKIDELKNTNEKEKRENLEIELKDLEIELKDLDEKRVLRGGAWDTKAENCRSAKRQLEDPNWANFSFGFRIILVPKKNKTDQKLVDPCNGEAEKKTNL